MAPPDTIWHKESLKLKEIFGTREGFEICPNNFSPRPNFPPPVLRIAAKFSPQQISPFQLSHVPSGPLRGTRHNGEGPAWTQADSL